MTEKKVRPFEGVSVVSPISGGLCVVVGILLAIFTLNDILTFGSHHELKNILVKGFMSLLFLFTGFSIVTRLKQETRD